MKKKIFRLCTMLFTLVYAVILLAMFREEVNVWLNIALVIVSTLNVNDAIHDVLAARK